MKSILILIASVTLSACGYTPSVKQNLCDRADSVIHVSQQCLETERCKLYADSMKMYLHELAQYRQHRCDLVMEHDHADV